MSLQFWIRSIGLCLVATSCTVSQAAILFFAGTFSGANENPANNSPATGSVFATLDDVARTLNLNATYSGLQGTITQAHLHAPAASATVNAGVAVGNTSLPGLTLGVNSGTYNQTIDLNQQTVYNTNYFNNNGGNVAAVSTAFMDALKAGQSYFNIHTSSFGGGEIRANLTAVPEPSSMVILAAIGMGYGAYRFRRLAKQKKAV